MSRTTALAAYRELISQGWLVARPTSGTYVAAKLPDPVPLEILDGPVSEPATRPGKSWSGGPTWRR